MIFYGRRQWQGENCPGKLPDRRRGVCHGVHMLRSAVKRTLLTWTSFRSAAATLTPKPGSDTEASPRCVDLPVTIKCCYNNVNVPADMFRIIVVQDLAKLHHNLDGMAKICPAHLCSKGLNGALARLTRSLTRHAVLKRCILVEGNCTDRKAAKKVISLSSCGGSNQQVLESVHQQPHGIDGEDCCPGRGRSRGSQVEAAPRGRSSVTRSARLLQSHRAPGGPRCGQTTRRSWSSPRHVQGEAQDLRCQRRR